MKFVGSISTALIALILLVGISVSAEEYRVINNGITFGGEGGLVLTGEPGGLGLAPNTVFTDDERAAFEARMREARQRIAAEAGFGGGEFMGGQSFIPSKAMYERRLSEEYFTEVFIPSQLGTNLSPESKEMVKRGFPAEGINIIEAHNRLRMTPEWQRIKNPNGPANVEEFISSITSDSNSFDSARCNEEPQKIAKLEPNVDNQGEHNYQNLLRLYSALERRGDPRLGGYLLTYHKANLFDPNSIAHPDISDAQIETYKSQVRDSLSHLRSVCGASVAGVSTSGPDDGFRANHSVIRRDGIVQAQ